MRGVPGTGYCNVDPVGSWFGLSWQGRHISACQPANLEDSDAPLCFCAGLRRTVHLHCVVCTCPVHSMHACFAFPCICICMLSECIPACIPALHVLLACTTRPYLGSWHAGNSGVMGCAFGPLPCPLWCLLFGRTCQAISLRVVPSRGPESFSCLTWHLFSSGQLLVLVTIQSSSSLA
jgi:hypothetical protein